MFKKTVLLVGVIFVLAACNSTRDGKGSILATGNTDRGKRPTKEFSRFQCIFSVFSFQLDNVSKSDFYSVEVGRRGQLNFS